MAPPPFFVVSASYANSTHIDVTFDAALSSAGSAPAYTVVGSDGVGATVSAAIIQSSLVARITVTALTEGVDYLVTVTAGGSAPTSAGMTFTTGSAFFTAPEAGITLIAKITPKNSGTFAMLDDRHLIGGFRTVLTADARDAITAAHRKVGMWVVTQDDGKKWQLNPDLSTWVEFTGGGGGFTAGGDLSGSSSSQTVVGLQTYAVSASAPSTGHALVWSGSAWAPTMPGGDLSGTFASATVSKLQGRSMLSTAPTLSQVIGWDGSAWGPSTLPVSSASLGEGARILQRTTNASLSSESGVGWVNYPYLADGSSGTYGPNESWAGTSTWGFVLKDFSAWQNRGFAIIGTSSGGANKIWFIANRVFGGFRFSGSASAPPPLITFNIGGATGSSAWTILEGAWGGNGLTSPSGVYGDNSGILLVGNPTTGDICRVARGVTPALLDPVVNLAAGPIAMSKILWTGGLYAWIVANGTLYCLSNLFQQGTSFGGSVALTATAVSGLPAGVVTTEMTSDGMFLYVPDSANSKIHKISLATNLFVSSITVATGPNNLVYDGENFWFTSTSAFSPTLYVVNSSGSTLASWANGPIYSNLFPLANNPASIQGVFNGEYVVFMDPSGASVKADPKSLKILSSTAATACARIRAFPDQFPSDVYSLYYSGIQRMINLHRPVVTTDRLVVSASIAVAGALAAGSGGNVLYMDDTQASGTGAPNNISRLYVSTKSGTITIYLPRRPVDGMEVMIKDYYGKAATSNITIKSHQIYAGSASGAASTPSGFPSFSDATVTSGDFGAVGVYPGDLVQITAGPSGAHNYRASGPFGGTIFHVDEASVTNETGLTYTIVEPLEKSAGGQGDTDTINTNRGYRRYQYCRFVGWVLLDWR